MLDNISNNSKLANMYAKFGKKTLIMGILNLTPDSFSDGGLFIDPKVALDHAIEMVNNGADIIDIGGESTKPGIDPISAEIEQARVIPVIKELSSKIDIPISIDTYKASTARAALDCGADIINDISAATFDEQMPALAIEKQCPIIIMHTTSSPQTMQNNPCYKDVVSDIYDYLENRANILIAAGLNKELLMIDPGIGFGKTVQHNLSILRMLNTFKTMGYPLLIGTSRKSSIKRVIGSNLANDVRDGTAATVALSIANGADIVRVHDVREMSNVAKMADAIIRNNWEEA